MNPVSQMFQMMTELFMAFFYVFVLIALGRIWHHTKRQADLMQEQAPKPLPKVDAVESEA